MELKNSGTVAAVDYALVLKRVKHHVLMMFQSHDTSRLLYHNRSHTEQVVDACTQMADYYRLNNRDRFIVKTAAWFHDTGYFDTVNDHEKTSAYRAEVFLREEGIDAETVAAVKSCIMATRLPQQPANRLEEILCDADLSHLGMDGFFKRNKLLREELSILNNEAINKRKWHKRTLQLLEGHQYFTDYCRKQLTGRKQQHIETLKRKMASAVHENSLVANVGVEKKPEKEKEKENPADKRMEVIFRISSTNNLRLSNMADSKAHIMITVNSIIISILLSVLVRNMDKYDYLTIPVMLLLAVNLATIIFSMLATKPRLPGGQFTEADVEEKKVSLLFFGNYFRMNFDDYAASLTKVMEDRSRLHMNLIRDIYSQGILLSKKYRMLKIAYTVFMYGLVASVIAFVLKILTH